MCDGKTVFECQTLRYRSVVHGSVVLKVQKFAFCVSQWTIKKSKILIPTNKKGGVKVEERSSTFVEVVEFRVTVEKYLFIFFLWSYRRDAMGGSGGKGQAFKFKFTGGSWFRSSPSRCRYFVSLNESDNYGGGEEPPCCKYRYSIFPITVMRRRRK